MVLARNRVYCAKSSMASEGIRREKQLNANMRHSGRWHPLTHTNTDRRPRIPLTNMSIVISSRKWAFSFAAEKQRRWCGNGIENCGYIGCGARATHAISSFRFLIFVFILLFCVVIFRRLMAKPCSPFSLQNSQDDQNEILPREREICVYNLI